VIRSRCVLAIGLVGVLLASGCSSGAAPAPGTSSAASVEPTAVVSPSAALADRAPATSAASQTVIPSPTTPPAAPTPTPALTTAAPTGTPGPSPSSGSAVGEEDVRKMAEAWAAARSFRITITSADPSSSGTMLWEVVRPDRSHVKLTMGGQTAIESIQIGQDQYNFFNGKWTKQTAPGNIPTNLLSDPQEIINGFNDSLASGDSVTRGNLVTIEGKSCQQWILTSADPASSGTMCVGVSDYLPVEFRSADGKYVMRFSDWNAPIAINPPPM